MGEEYSFEIIAKTLCRTQKECHVVSWNRCSTRDDFFFHSIFRVQSECSSRRSKFLGHFRRAQDIPSRLLQIIYILRVENLSLFPGIIVRPGTKHIILTRSFVCNPCSCGRSAFLVYIDYETNLFLISENFGVIFDTEFHEIANMVMDP